MNTEDLRDVRDNDQEVNEFNLLDFALQLLQNWYWIAISVAITLCIAVFACCGLHLLTHAAHLFSLRTKMVNLQAQG